jgi:carboxyl-terminal processing protease
MKLKWLGLALLVGLAPTWASAAEQANAPTATGETGLFTLLTGDTLPQGEWSFGLYYNNWDPLVDIREFPTRRKDEMSLDYHRVDAGIGYIKVDWFTKGKSTEVANLIRTLQKSGSTKLILDLRNSADGDPAEGIATANLFLDHGTITYLQGQKFPKQAFTAEADKAITKLPVVVLVNRGTAGPAEIVAAAILENARGDVLGDKTFGAGSIQKMIPLQDKSALNLTVAKYYSPQGKAIQDSAVTPNILVAGEEEVTLPDEDENATPANDQEPKKAPQDEQLKKAIEVVKTRQAKA